jgi:tetratricopeptide (TPR) repeat protein
MVSDEAVRLQRKLAEGNPSANERGLGIMLNSLARRLLEVSRAEEALSLAEEALEIWRQLAAATPGTFDSQLDRAIETRGRALSTLGHHNAS